MQEIITRAGSFIAIIILGHILRRIHVLEEDAFHALSKVVIRITLPATIIVSFSGKEMDPALLSLALIGLGGGILYSVLGWLVNRRNSKEQQAFEMLNMSGYNVGNFTLPFVQSFLGPAGVIATGLFDTGNACICFGAAYGMASMVKEGTGFSFKRIGKTLLKSVPFMTYLIMVVLNLIKISLPGPILSVAQVISNANAFTAMLMIGVGFKLSGDWKQIGRIIKILAVRYGTAVVLALGCYFLLPFSIEVRQALVILMFSPIASAAPAFTAELKGDVGLASAVNSLSILCSIFFIVGILVVML